LNLKIMLPSRVCVDTHDVLRLVVETTHGSWGMLPNRCDCVAALIPGILSYETRSGGVTYVAVDAGLLVKTGREVRVSVRRAVAGSDLSLLKDTVAREYAVLDQFEQDVRHVSEKLENGFLQRMLALHRE
jgi:F-type H+-transporting ATPase subunit epsilon